MQLAAIAVLVAHTTLTSAFANPATPSSTAGNAIAALEAAVATAAEIVAPNLDVLEQPYRPQASMEQICSTLEFAASAHELPVAFFARLIWQESRFKIDAKSPVGARGIAQFMPGTAQWRGLADPLDPIASLYKSADYLRELRNQFGNLGLAAAAYNGGSGRVQKWLDGRGGMPRETRDYVRIVTGSPIEEWRARANATAEQAGRIPQRVPCPDMVAMSAAAAPDPEVKKDSARSMESTWVRRGKRTKSGRNVRLAGKHSGTKAHKRSARHGRSVKSVVKGRKPGSRRVRVAAR